ncbi:hypothetical protein TrVFT333_002848 [Trichoderma virens FT-333]|nr:hypothetical protein TrVFT333_002848 [Trichoderma virens FT-333]
MLVGICGSICSGKKTVAQYLVEHHGFKHLYLQPPASVSDQDATGETSPSPDGGNAAFAGVTTSNGTSPASHVFATAEDLLDFVTRRWRSRFVTTDIPTEKVLDVFIRRPFFLLISIDAPLTVRWRRFQQRSKQPEQSVISLEEFVTQNDLHLYDPHTGLQPLISRATVRLLNTSSSLAHLYATLGKLDIPNPDRMRPGWDTYFMALASLAAQRSNCMKRRVGCVLVGRERRVISTGYNGTPRGLRNCAEGGCPRCNEGAALGIKICQVGIAEVVYAHGYSMDTETAEVFRQAGVKLRQFIPPPNGLIHLEKMELY